MRNRVVNQDREKAIFALESVEQFIETHNIEYQKKYRAYLRTIPSMILTNGLGATITFIFSKNSEEVYNQLGSNIYDWLNKNTYTSMINLEHKREPKEKLEELMKKIILLNSTEYRAITNEILALFAWLKRFAEGKIEGEEADG